jgi:glycosyltransferase involved in cell wall biosynthesis
MDRPIVSVWLITYNHEPYIAEAIEGVLKQQTTFSVELIIGEDCSTDGTRAIVQAYKDRYPDRITLFLPDANLGMVGILRPTYALCRGKYVAMLDGDDYWTDPLKLQKQVDQLEYNAAARFSFHRVHILHEATGKLISSIEPVWPGQPGQLHLADFLGGDNSVVTLSVLFRNDLGTLPEWYYELPYPDLALYYLLLIPGGVAQYLPDAMGVYRVHATGWFSSMSSQHRHRNGALFLEAIGLHLPTQFHNLLMHELQHNYYELLVFSLKNRQLGEATRNWLRLGVHKPTTTTHRLRPWPHSLLLTGFKYTGRLLHQIRHR